MSPDLPARTRATAAAAVLLLSLLAAACAAGRGATGEQTDAGPTTVQVDNGNFADVVVYVLGSGQYYRLGDVTGHSRATLRLPRHMERALDVRLVADPIGSDASYFSERILFRPGDVLVLNVGPTINLSSISVRGGGGG